jgi:hypothetical protein
MSLSKRLSAIRAATRHQAVVIDSIEELFEIETNYYAVAFSDIALRLGYRLMGRASRPEAVAVLGEGWVPTLLQNLQQCLLDQSVDDTRHAELPDPAVRLGYLDPFDRLQPTGSRKQLGSYVWPMSRSVVDGHPIHAPELPCYPEHVATRAQGSLARTPSPSGA